MQFPLSFKAAGCKHRAKQLSRYYFFVVFYYIPQRSCNKMLFLQFSYISLNSVFNIFSRVSAVFLQSIETRLRMLFSYMFLKSLLGLLGFIHTLVSSIMSFSCSQQLYLVIQAHLFNVLFLIPFPRESNAEGKPCLYN